MEFSVEECFVLAYDDDILIGALGFDGDTKNGTAEIWGPFIEVGKWYIANDLWEALIEVIPVNIKKLNMFINKKNKNCIKFAEGIEFLRLGGYSILSIDEEAVSKLPDERCPELSKEYYDEFIMLHNKVFKGAYYTGEDIIDRISENRKVFMVVVDESLAGFIYTEGEPEFGEGSIEFFAVQEEQRGKRIGARLIAGALKWLFSLENIKKIILSVNLENSNAIKLYKHVGFSQEHELFHYAKNYDKK
jgi:ribosomal protein S18 acetylase RimI-like enzyme